MDIIGSGPRIFLFVIAPTLVVLMACNSESQAISEDVYYLSDSELTEALESGGEGELEFLEDGELSFAEYQNAFLQFQHCVETGGGEFVPRPTLTARREYTWDIIITGAVPPTIVKTCRERYFTSTQHLWSRFVAPSQEDLELARSYLRQCLTEAGEITETASSWDRLVSNPSDQFLDCVEAMQEEFGLPGFVG